VFGGVGGIVAVDRFKITRFAGLIGGVFLFGHSYTSSGLS
jgi:hypothetical protein